ncbi:hypothetical protein L1887_19614 [Cichorium endivia]|nr:hypothetical protein L1887_19614 [Cichorium endivia]
MLKGHSGGESSEVTSFDRLKGKDLEHLKIKLGDIEFATDNFAKRYCIGSGGYGDVYKAVLNLQGKNSSTVDENNKGESAKIGNIVAIKRIRGRVDMQGEDGFFAEVETLASCKNLNIISLLGFCVEGPEKIIVYEYASNGSLDDYLESIGNRAKLSWAQRIRICLGIARGLHYLHSSTDDKQNIIHRDIKSANILLDQNWEAKIADLGLSKLYSLNEESSTINTMHIAGTEVYLDPEYLRTEDVNGLGPIARRRYNEGTLKEMIDPILKPESDEILLTQNEGLNEESLDTFFKIAYKCLAESQAERPTMEVVIKALEQALRFQENFKENLKFSLEEIKLATEDFSEKNIIGEERYWKLYRGEIPHANGKYSIELQKVVRQHFPEGKLAESVFEGIKEQIVQQSLATFQEIVLQCLHDERQKRPTAAQVLMQLKKAFEFQEDHEMWEPKLPTDYKEIILMSKTPEVYSMAKKEDLYNMLFKGILIGDGKVVKHEEIKELKETQQLLKSDINVDQFFSLNEVNKKKHYTLSVKEALYESSNVKFFDSIHSTPSRFQDVIELQRQQVFYIKCMIGATQSLSPDTDYVCYLVFKISEKCHGLHCPVIVRNLLKRKNKEKRIIYFRSPSPCNVNDTDRVPEEREDGWMEVNVWQFNSNHNLRNDCIPVRLKLICYEGTMSGLIVSNLEFRPM